MVEYALTTCPKCGNRLVNCGLVWKCENYWSGKCYYCEARKWKRDPRRARYIYGRSRYLTAKELAEGVE